MGGLALTGTFGTRRTLAIMVALGMLVPAAEAWSNTIASPGTGVLSLLLTGALLVVAVLLACATDEEQIAKVELLLLVAGVMTLLVQSAASIPAPASYGTDDAGFLHAAAAALKAGRDPYSANLSWAIHAFGFQPSYTTDGGHWTFFGYPSLTLLVTTALLSLRSGIAVATIVNVASLAVAMALLYRVLPERLRALAPLVCVVLPALPSESVSGVSEVMLLPTLIVVAFRWRDVGSDGVLGRDGILRAVALGLAASTNQLAWFMVPFLLAGMVMMRQPELGFRGSVRVTSRYAGIAALVFLVLNVGFFLWSPSNWLSRILAGFIRPLIPSGQGLPINLTMFAHLGGGNIAAFSATVALCYAGLLAVYLLRFGRLHWCCFLLPSVALWFGDRSLLAYFTVPAVPALVSVLNGGEVPRLAGFGGRLRDPTFIRVASLAAFVPAATALAIALSSPAPLTIRLVAAAKRPGAGALRVMTITVSNRSTTALVPHFETSADGTASGFWRIRRGPHTLQPGTSRSYVISTPSPASDPPIGSAFLVEAVTAKPVTFSAVSVTVRPANSS